MNPVQASESFAIMEKQDLSFFKLIPQAGVRHAIFPNCEHNAAWDILTTKNGRVFFSQCAELQVSTYVRLYEYLPATNTFKLHFKLEDVTFQQDAAIRGSKIHTSMAEMNDGRLIMATHTTSQSPLHPGWLPYSFYRHQFEGFQGSNILMYDPDTGIVEHRGIPVPFESIYGGAYDAKYHAYYFTCMMRMHAYRFDIATNEIKDLGQLSENAVYKLATGPDGHIYSTTKMGRLFRLNVDKQCIEDLGIQLPLDYPDSSYLNRMQIGHCAWHPDGKLYCCVTRHPHLFRFDPRSMALEDLGDASTEYAENKALNWPTGIAVDSKGVVWYGVCITGIGIGGGVKLYSYDPVSREKKSWGFLGSTVRALHIVSEMTSHGDMLYVLDSNHLLGSNGVLAVDLSQMTEQAKADAPLSEDAALYLCAKGGRDTYPGDKQAFDEQLAVALEAKDYNREVYRVYSQNTDVFQTSEGYTYKLWQKVGAENSQVCKLQWVDNTTLTGVCGSEQYYTFRIENMALKSIQPLDNFVSEKTDLSAYQHLALPYVAGRQYKAVATAAIELYDRSVLIGTEDAMVALYKDGKVFSLGQAAAYGPIRGFATDKERKKVYGIASYPQDIGSVFTFDVDSGLRQEGRISVYSRVPDYFADSSEPSAVAVSPDGQFVAFGVEDRLGVVYICRTR